MTPEDNRDGAPRPHHTLESLQQMFPNIVGTSERVRQMLTLAAQAAARPKTTVLLLGPTGVGKELLAHGIHYNSSRWRESFIAVNCAAIPDDLIETTLFGHEKGSFTGAIATQVGKFEQADGGTIFLDEVGDMSLKVQAKILRVLEDGEVEGLGQRTKKVDVRVIAATNKDLDKNMANGTFREDLYYRLKIFDISVPPLRDRPTDIPLLIDHYLDYLSREAGQLRLPLTDQSMTALQCYSWNGNIRELRNKIEKALTVAQGREAIEPSDLFTHEELSGLRTAQQFTNLHIPPAAVDKSTDPVSRREHLATALTTLDIQAFFDFLNDNTPAQLRRPVCREQGFTILRGALGLTTKDKKQDLKNSRALARALAHLGPKAPAVELWLRLDRDRLSAFLGETGWKTLTQLFTTAAKTTTLISGGGSATTVTARSLQPVSSLPGTLDQLIANSNGLIRPVSDLLDESLMNTLDDVAFRILLLFPLNRDKEPVTIHYQQLGKQHDQFTLTVDIRDQHVGVFNNEGKKWLDGWLKSQPHLRDIQQRMMEASKTTHDLIMGRAPTRTATITWSSLTNEIDVPFRWASAGILPIAVVDVGHRRRRFAVLYFRDIKPVGLNVCNGASESEIEWRDPVKHLVSREAAEELVLLERRPQSNSVANREPMIPQFTLVDAATDLPLGPLRIGSERMKKFVERHKELRLAHDDIGIDIEDEDRRRRHMFRPATTPLRTSMMLKVISDVDLQPAGNSDIIWSLNPLEFGIEAIRLCEFDMSMQEWLLDGELYPSGVSQFGYLVRRPVILIDVEFLREQFLAVEPHSLGAPLPDMKEDPALERKRLTVSEIPVHIFDGTGRELIDDEKAILYIGPDAHGVIDVDGRRRRLDALNERLTEIAKSVHSRRDRNNAGTLELERNMLAKEREQIMRWMYEKEHLERFMQVQSQRKITEGPLTTLCPVTWKTLEIAFERGWL